MKIIKNFIIKNLKILIFFLLIFIFLINFVKAETPQYSVTIELKNKNIESSENLNYTVYVRGGGYCSKAWYLISTEGIMTNSTNYMLGSINGSNPKELKIFGQPTQYCYIGGKVKVENISGIPEQSGQMRTELYDFFKDEGFHELMHVGSMKPRDNAKSGYYNFNAALYCLNNNQWYTFQGSREFRVLAKGEERQFITTNKAFWVSLIALFFSIVTTFLKEDTKERIRQWLRNLIR